MRILILDDDEALRTAISRILLQYDYEIDCSENARNAVEMVSKNEYDFILVDYRMPEEDGTWFLRHANLSRRTKTLLITSFVNRDVINEMFALGVAGYLIKPFGEEELLRHINYHSESSLRTRELIEI